MEIEAVTASYRRWAPVYDGTFGAFTRVGRRRAVEHVNRRGGSVLEVGVGTGLSLGHYGPKVRVTGIDFSPEMLARARARVEALKLKQVVALERMDARSVAFADETFDTVVAMHLISVVPEPERVVAEMARVCRPGGEILLLNHFLHETGALAFLGRRFGRRANQLGWHSDFTMEPVLSCPALELVEQRPSPPFGIFTLLRLRKRAADPAQGAVGEDASQIGHPS
jgi:phosphatidylethanolamine/phosphatidyl-N-methylethanolamine N-methyltransferase